MSSYNNANINFNKVKNKRTSTLSLDLANGRSKIFDLTTNEWGGLDFDPDYVILKYIAFSSQNANPNNRLPVLICDFLSSETDVLAPYIARTSIQSFNIQHKVSFNVNKQYAKIESVVFGDNQEDLAYNQGTVIVCLEWVRYHRYLSY